MSTTLTHLPPDMGPPSRRARVRMWIRGMKPRTLWLNIGLAVLLIGAIVLAVLTIGNPGTPTVAVRTAAVSRGTVTASVTGSGNAATSVSTQVNFQASGMVTAIDVKPGDAVMLGQVLATIDPASQQAALRTAQAALDQAKANLAQAQAGPTDVKRQQDQLAITQAQQDLNSAQTQLGHAQQQRQLDQASTDSAIQAAQKKLANDDRESQIAVDQAQTNVNTACSSSSTSSTNSNLLSGSSTQTTTSPSSGSSSCTSAEQSLAAAKASQKTTHDTDQAAVTTAQQNQKNTLLADDKAITTAQQTVSTEQNDIKAAQLAAQADEHPETPDQIAAVQATVDSAQVNVDTAQQALDEATLKAPQAGVVLAVNGKVGESAGNTSSNNSSSSSSSSSSNSSASNASSSTSSAGSGFVVIANASQLAVTANIAEADASKIQLGQQAKITFPATGTTATGSVTQITPQSTVTNNVVLYPITVSIDSAPPGVGVGATASLAITTGSKDDVLVAPTAAITTLGDRHTVTVRRGGVDTVVPVEVGLTGDTTTEITGGVEEGDVLVLPSATPTTNSPGIPRAGGGG